MNTRENYLKAVKMNYPEYIPVNFYINSSCFDHYENEYLYDLMEEHKILFPGFKRPKKGKKLIEHHYMAKKDEPYTDDFGCIWQTSEDGIVGTVTKHPLPDLSKLNEYKMPDPKKCMGIGPINWDDIEKNVEERRKKGLLTNLGLNHGHTFLRLCDIMGYENLLYAMHDQDPRLDELIEMLLEFNMFLVNKLVSFNLDVISYPEDLGMQKGPMISPEMFRRYIKPSYGKLMAPAKKSNSLVHMHSDGDLHLLIDDIIDSGVDIINLQDLVNGIDWIGKKFGNETCVELDLDRQRITPKGSKEEIEKLIKSEVEKIGSKKGGIMLVYGLYPGVKQENIKYIMDLMEKYAFYYN